MSSQQKRILMVEDDQNFGSILKEYLSMHNLLVELFKTGEEAFTAYKKDPESYELCIMDIMLPGIGGYELAKKIRDITPDVRIMFITAKNSKEDRMKGYKLGATDFITKPFDDETSKILPIKIKGILGKTDSSINIKTPQKQITEKQKWAIGEYIFNSLLRTLYHEKCGTIPLSPKENELIIMLLENKNEVLHREEALGRIWNKKGDDEKNSRSMDVYITRIRKYFKHDPKIEIKNLYKLGFRLIINGGEIEAI